MDMEIIGPRGIWPTMITPFTEVNTIDYQALEHLVDWYLANKVHGLFAVCQSSEMQFLSLEERVDLASFVVNRVGGRVPVACSGHVSPSIEEQIRELKAMAQTGADILVLVTNRLAKPDEPDAVWKKNLDRVMAEIPSLPLGLYECPNPYNRLLAPETLKWCAQTGRFIFFKDTSCDLKAIRAKADIIKGTRLNLFNANSATLLDSLKAGAAGYTGVMGNFHPSLYVWLMENWKRNPHLAQSVQDFLGLASVIEQQYYPINAKYYCQLEGLPILLNSRSRGLEGWKPSYRVEVEQLHRLSTYFAQKVIDDADGGGQD